MVSALKIVPPVIAHRGACAYAPENTLISFAKAAQLGAKWVEFDVMLAACKTPFVFHDEDLHRTTNAHGNIAKYTFQYLSTLDAGSWFDPIYSGERIPSLVQVLAFLKNANMSANIEIKPLPGQDEETAIRTLEIVKQYFPQPNPAILFSSFSVAALRALRKQSPVANIGLLLHDWHSDWQKICDELNCISVNVFDEILTDEMARKIKSTGRMLLCYTVNDPKQADLLYSWGVDAVFSDAPDIILENLQVKTL